jgi:hypothetical protein
LLLTQHDAILKSISDKDTFENADGTSSDPFAKYVPRNSEADKYLKGISSHYEDLFKTDLPCVSQLKNTRSMFRYTQNERAEMQTQMADLLRHG